MKKWIAIVLVAMMALALVACGGKGAKGEGIVGTWKLADGEGEAQQAVQMILAMGGTMTFTFNEDGTGHMKMDVMGQQQDQDFNYTIENNQIVIDGAGADYKLDGDKLTIQVEGMAMIFDRQ